MVLLGNQQAQIFSQFTYCRESKEHLVLTDHYSVNAKIKEKPNKLLKNQLLQHINSLQAVRLHEIHIYLYFTPSRTCNRYDTKLQINANNWVS